MEDFLKNIKGNSEVESSPQIREINVQDNISVSVGVETLLTVLKNNLPVGFRRTLKRFSAATDTNPDQTLRQMVQGPCPQGENDSQEVASRFIQSLNTKCEKFSPPYRPDREEGIDFVSLAEGNPDKKIKLQVTRPPDESFYKKWAHSENSKATITKNVNELADKLQEAIEKKNKKIASPTDINLLLDCTRLMLYLIPEVHQTFQRLYFQKLNSWKFDEIWIIGPSPDLCHRLK